AATLPANDALVSGTNQPTAYGAPPVFAQPGPSAPHATALAAVNGKDPNGTWSLYVFDDSVGDAGSVAAGWSLALTTLTTSNAIADLGVNLASTPSSLFVGANVTNVITVTNLGPSPATAIFVTNVLDKNVNFVSASLTPAGSLIGSGQTQIAFSLGGL